MINKLLHSTITPLGAVLWVTVKKIFTKAFWTSHGETSAAFRQRGETYCKWTFWIGIVMCVVGVCCIIFFASHIEAAVSEVWASVGALR
jgi:hypothetical protein